MSATIHLGKTEAKEIVSYLESRAKRLREQIEHLRDHLICRAEAEEELSQVSGLIVELGGRL